uniref:SLC26A/SulP transporter domain-containing protein n=1 Tax=Panagrolaimus sp. JU765 TaxID=591449 RepID=A0AC34RAY1_9BILA
MFAVIALMTGNVEQRIRSDHNLTSDGFTGSLEDNESVQIIATLTFAIGLVLAAMALLQVHFVSAYLSDELIGGFTTGAAYHVMWSQIPKIFALKLPKQNGLFVLFKIIYDFFKNIEDTNFWSLTISVCCMIFLYLGKTFLNPFVSKYCPIPIPLELIVVIVTTVLSNLMEFHDKHNVAVVGKIPTGFPLPSLPKLDKLHLMFPDAIVIAVVIYAVSFSVAKLFAKKHKYKLNPAQEIRAISTVQILSAFMLCHPASASLSRSTINSQLGVHSQSGIFRNHVVVDPLDWTIGQEFANVCVGIDYSGCFTNNAFSSDTVEIIMENFEIRF